MTYVFVAGNLDLETLALAHLLNNLANLAGAIQRRATRKDLPVVEDGLREGLAGGGGTEIAVEAERLHDGQVGLDGEERSTRALLLVEDVTSPAGKDAVDTTHGGLGDLDLDQEDGLEESGLGKEGRGVQNTTSSRDDLATTTVDSIGVEGNIEDVEADRAHGLLTDRTLTGGPLEAGDDRVLDFLEVLDGLGLVNDQVGTSGVRTESPDLAGIGDIPAEVVGKDTSAGLEIVTRSDLATLNLLAELLIHGLSNHVETVVLVGGLGEGSHAGLASNGLTVLDDGVRDGERNTSVVLLEILQANLEMELTGTGNDVLTRLVGHGQNARIRLGQTLETLDELGKILGVLDLDGALHDGRDGELHDLEVVGGLAGGEGTRLKQELVNTDQADNVTGGHVINGLDLATHHEDSALNGLDEEILLLAGGVVGALDADLETGADGTGEDTAESVEAALIRGRHHLGDVKHEGTLGVAVADANGGLIINGTLVQSLGTVLLSSNGRGEVENHHLQKAVGSRQEGLHDGLQELLALLLTVLSRELEVELLKESGDLVLLEVHDGREDLEDGVKDELAESTVELLALVGAGLGPLLGGGVEVVVALYTSGLDKEHQKNIRQGQTTHPETLHHLVAVDTELLGVAGGELADGESPAVETGTEGNGTLVGVNLDVTERLVEVSRDDDVDGLDGTREGLVKVLLGDLELEESTVDLVDDNNRLDALTESLAKHSLGLDADTLNGVDDDESTIGDTESSSDLRREINVTGRVDQVDKEVLACSVISFLPLLKFQNAPGGG